MGSLQASWAKLSGWQQFIAGTIAATILGWPASKLLDWLAASFQWLSFLAIVSHYMIAIITDRGVIGLMFGATLALFGPPAWKAYRKHGLGQIVSVLMACFVLLMGGIIAYSMAVGTYSALFEAPTKLTPPLNVRNNPDGSARAFTEFSLRDLRRPFSRETEIGAELAVKSEIGKWMVITGVVKDVRSWSTDNSYAISMSAPLASSVLLAFKDSQTNRVIHLRKGERVEAVCRISSSSETTVFFEDCEFTPGRS